MLGAMHRWVLGARCYAQAGMETPPLYLAQ